jgi:hypothetical protein
MLKVAFGQTKILRRPVIGLLHAFVFWGFCVILIGSLEMTIDGLFDREKVLRFLGVVYDIIMASGDLFAFIIIVAIMVFLVRRIFLDIKRFSGIEMQRISHIDANIALTLILILMITLIGMNTFYIRSMASESLQVYGYYPVSNFISGFLNTDHHSSMIIYRSCWWTHILIIFIFANYLPYSKHFHVFMSVPNVFLSRLEPLGKLPVMLTLPRMRQNQVKFPDVLEFLILRMLHGKTILIHCPVRNVADVPQLVRQILQARNFPRGKSLWT